MFLWSWVILSQNKECLHLYLRFLTFIFVQDHFQEHFQVFFMVLVKFIHEYFTSFVPIVMGKTFPPSYLFFMAYIFLFIFFNIIKIYTILTQQYDTNSIQVPVDGKFNSVQFSSVPQSCPTLCDPMNRSTPGLPVHHQLPELTQTHVHRVSDAIQPSHPLSSPSPPVPNPSQHQSLFQWVNSLHEVVKVLEFQL